MGRGIADICSRPRVFVSYRCNRYKAGELAYHCCCAGVSVYASKKEAPIKIFRSPLCAAVGG